jgi:peptidoglycan/xylan/chitin deacetylase (PgdA/CDA1 family)
VARLDCIGAFNSALSKGMVIVSFDDSYAKIYSKALPILQEYDIKTTQFVIAANVVAANPTSMTIANLKAMQDSGHGISSHTWAHTNLESITDSSVIDSCITKPKRWLAENGFEEPDIMSYPNGGYNKIVARLANRHFSYIRATGKTMQGSYYIPYPLMQKKQIPWYGFLNTQTVGQWQDQVDSAIMKKCILWVVIHDVDDVPTTGKIATDSLRKFCAYLKSKVDAGQLYPVQPMRASLDYARMATTKFAFGEVKRTVDLKRYSKFGVYR